MIEVWFDGCCEPINPGGNGGFGVIIKQDGKVLDQISGFCGKGDGMTNNVAEYSGAIAGMNWLLNAGLEQEEVLIRGDSQMVVQQMSLKWKIKRGAYQEKAMEAMTLRRRFTNLKFDWIPREQNLDCDCLSKIGAGSGPR